MQINANYYAITPRKFIAGTKGSYGIEKLDISFSEEWNGLAKKVIIVEVLIFIFLPFYFFR